MKGPEKTWNFESIAALAIGIVVINNLYLLTFLVGISPGVAYAMLCLLGGVIGVLHGRFHDLVIPEYNKFVGSLLVLSVLCLTIDQTLYGPSALDPNGFVRIAGTAILFTWFYGLRRRIDIRRFVQGLAFASFLIAASMATMHYVLMQMAPELMNLAYEMLFADQYLDRVSDRRVSGLFVDSNYFAASISLFYFLAQFRRKRSLLFFVLYAFCINISGSRLGLVLFAIVAMQMLWNTKIGTKIALTLALMLFVSVSVVQQQRIEGPTYSYEGGNENVAARLLDRDVAGQVEGSTSARLRSLYDGVSFGRKYGYLSGPGLMAFGARWDDWVNRYVPHSSPVTMFAQFGMLCLIPLLLLARSIKDGIEVFGPAFGAMFLAPILLLPFFPYYATAFLFAYAPTYFREQSRPGGDLRT